MHGVDDTDAADEEAALQARLLSSSLGANRQPADDAAVDEPGSPVSAVVAAETADVNAHRLHAAAAAAAAAASARGLLSSAARAPRCPGRATTALFGPAQKPPPRPHTAASSRVESSCGSHPD
jgi:hypothetical protein